jgi:subtilisin family serine protease
MTGPSILSLLLAGCQHRSTPSPCISLAPTPIATQCEDTLLRVNTTCSAVRAETVGSERWSCDDVKGAALVTVSGRSDWSGPWDLPSIDEASVDELDPSILSLPESALRADWAMDRIDQQSQWTSSNEPVNWTSGSGAGVRAYVIDSGIRVVKPLKDRIDRVIPINGCGDERTEVCTNHATHMACLIGASGRQRYGPATATHFVDIRIERNIKGGWCIADLVRAFDRVRLDVSDHPAPSVVNVSLEIAPDPGAGPWLAFLDNQIADLRKIGVITVVSAGNHPRPCTTHSCSDFRDLHSAIVVGALSTDDKPMACYDPGTVTLFAPGVRVGTCSAYDADAHFISGAASAATALVSGVVAVDLANSATYEPFLTPRQRADRVVRRLLARATPTQDRDVHILCAQPCPTDKCPAGDAPASSMTDCDWPR